MPIILTDINVKHFVSYSGVAGSGVCILSRFPIHDVLFHQWPLNGYVHKLHHGDWFGGKGVGLCQVYYNDLLINVYTAHASLCETKLFAFTNVIAQVSKVLMFFSA